MEIRKKIRPLRIAELIRKELSFILIKGIKDPRLSDVVITYVEVTDDLKQAKVFYWSSGSKENSLAGFESATGFLQRELRQRLKLRFIPKLRFLLDHSFHYRDKIEKILKDISKTAKDNL
jgi:ribosome-binding factor A